MRTVYALYGDRHCGLADGLVMPGTVLDYGRGGEQDEREIKLTPVSEWLWEEVWLWGIDQVIEFSGDDPLLLSDSGDMVHGSIGFYSDHLYSIDIDHQVQIAKMTMTPWRQAPTLCQSIMVYGTAAHDYCNNSAARLVHDAIAPWGWDQIVDAHLRFVGPDRFLLDTAHHGPSVSPYQHLRANGARRYAENRMRESIEYGDRIPGLYQRGHVHRNTYSPAAVEYAGQIYNSHIVITPPLCGPNGYGRKASRSTEDMRCGVYAVEVIDGEVEQVKPFIKRRDSRKTYTLPNEGVRFYSNMIADGGHKKHKKRKKGKRDLSKKKKKRQAKTGTPPTQAL